MQNDRPNSRVAPASDPTWPGFEPPNQIQRQDEKAQGHWSARQTRLASDDDFLASPRHCALALNLPARNDAAHAGSETGAPLRISEGFLPISNQSESISEGFVCDSEQVVPVPEDSVSGSRRFVSASDDLAIIPDDFVGDSNDFVPVPEGNLPIPDDFVRTSDDFLLVPDAG